MGVAVGTGEGAGVPVGEATVPVGGGVPVGLASRVGEGVGVGAGACVVVGVRLGRAVAAGVEGDGVDDAGSGVGMASGLGV